MTEHLEHESGHDSLSEPEDCMSKGTSYSLHSKRLEVKCLQRMSEAIGLATDAPATQTRKLIEMKLVEMDRLPSDVQVIVQGTDLDVSCDMFFWLMKME